MPLGWERINVKKTHPNKNIVFIKPRPGAHESTARDYLERIAAQCLPIMNSNHLSIVSLEEYEPNLEFWGRNFNNGEIIQLVLRSPSTGSWLPFRFVQMVMMHELAHCKEMNHSRAFWKVRNAYAEEMRALWEKKYTGDGLWGRGVLLENGAFEGAELGEGEVLPEHMCGGTFRSKGRGKRKVKEKPKITYKEAKERRIRKKFGVNGMTLGADEATKVKLEKGKKPAGKPRVAGSARGRELRAAAALARFEVKKHEEPEIKDEELVTDSEAEDEYEDDVVIKAEPNDALDINGERLLDSKGNGMVKVCEDEDPEGADAQQELRELRGIRRYIKPVKETTQNSARHSPAPPASEPRPKIKTEPNNEEAPAHIIPQSRTGALKSITPNPFLEPPTTSQAPPPISTRPSSNPNSPGTCPICSVHNNPTALTCTVCANVLQPDFVVGTWRCGSQTCRDESAYINAGDVGICGVCGERKT